MYGMDNFYKKNRFFRYHDIDRLHPYGVRPFFVKKSWCIIGGSGFIVVEYWYFKINFRESAEKGLNYGHS